MKVVKSGSKIGQVAIGIINGAIAMADQKVRVGSVRGLHEA
jgi:hypothetical protein